MKITIIIMGAVIILFTIFMLLNALFNDLFSSSLVLIFGLITLADCVIFAIISALYFGKKQKEKQQ